MGVVLKWEGLEDFRRALRSLPDDLKNEAAGIVEAAAEDAKKAAYFAYPTGPTRTVKRRRKGVTTSVTRVGGNLKKGLRVLHNAGRRFGTESIVKSTAKHAHLFEFGTGRRITNKGANRGVMPKAPENEAFIPIAIRIRRRMTKQLIELVRRAGFIVHE